jgi:hypothetical protein
MQRVAMTTLLRALCAEGLAAAMTIPAATNTVVFRAFVQVGARPSAAIWRGGPAGHPQPPPQSRHRARGHPGGRSPGVAPAAIFSRSQSHRTVLVQGQRVLTRCKSTRSKPSGEYHRPHLPNRPPTRRQSLLQEVWPHRPLNLKPLYINPRKQNT